MHVNGLQRLESQSSLQREFLCSFSTAQTSLFIHQAFGEEELTADEEWKHEKEISLPETEPEQISENPPPETSATQDQDSAPPLAPSDPGSDITAEPEDNSIFLNLQESTPDRQDIITWRLISCFVSTGIYLLYCISFCCSENAHHFELRYLL